MLSVWKATADIAPWHSCRIFIKKSQRTPLKVHLPLLFLRQLIVKLSESFILLMKKRKS